MSQQRLCILYSCPFSYHKAEWSARLKPSVSCDLIASLNSWPLLLVGQHLIDLSWPGSGCDVLVIANECVHSILGFNLFNKFDISINIGALLLVCVEFNCWLRWLQKVPLWFGFETKHFFTRLYRVKEIDYGVYFDIDEANICHWRNDAISVLFYSFEK